MPGLRSRIRGQALEQLARLSSISTASSEDFSKLCEPFAHDTPQINGYQNPEAAHGRVAAIPMTYKEYEVLIALCKAAPSINDPVRAALLVERLSPYMSECCSQAFSASPLFRKVRPSPWETLAYTLTSAELQVGIQHPAFRRGIVTDMMAFLRSSTALSKNYPTVIQSRGLSNSTSGQATHGSIVVLVSSLLGFFQAAQEHVDFWTPEERFEVLHLTHSLLHQRFLLDLESACSTIRSSRISTDNHDNLKLFLNHYDAAGRPLGGLVIQEAFALFVGGCASRLVSLDPSLRTQPVLTGLMASQAPLNAPRLHAPLLEKIADISVQEIANVDEESDYVNLGPKTLQRRAQIIKASFLTSYLCCSLADESVADSEPLLSWLEKILEQPQPFTDDTLQCTAMRCLALLAKSSDAVASNLSRTLPRYLTQHQMTENGGTVAAECLLYILRLLPQEAVITTLWGLGNTLSSSLKVGKQDPAVYANGGTNGRVVEDTRRISNISSSSLLPGYQSHKSIRSHSVVVVTFVTIARGFKDPKVTALALSILIQKVGKVSSDLDLEIIKGTARIAANGTAPEFRALLRLYTRLIHEGIAQEKDVTITAVTEALAHLGTALKGGSELYEIFLDHLLRAIISKGDVASKDQSLPVDTETASREIGVLLRPLSLLVANNLSTEGIEEAPSFPTLQRDAWYNVVAHGFSLTSRLGKKHMQELEVLARYSQPLIAEDRADVLESPIELNMVLKRSATSQSIARHRTEMVQLLPECEADIGRLDHPEVVFLKTAHLVESLRASAGDCTIIISYFVDPRLQGTSLGICIAQLAVSAIDQTIRTTASGRSEMLSAPFVSQQLSSMLEYCCHRVDKVQEVAYRCVDRLMSFMPSALCQRSSLFALLDLLTIMWSSCLEAETDEYEWVSSYTVPLGNTTVRLSDDFTYRQTTLRALHSKSKEWVLKALNIAPLDVKGLLQTYLSDYAEDDAFGHMSLGRSFALEMGAVIPMTDQRLGAIETDDNLNINTASDFMAQYTSRQEYRFTDPLRATLLEEQKPSKETLQSSTQKGVKVLQSLSKPSNFAILESLRSLYHRILAGEVISITTLRDVLRLAASLLCRSKDDQSTVLTLFVAIPYAIFTKHSIKLGLSLWMGVIKENARMESRLLVEIIEHWLTTVESRQGIFDDHLTHPEPFYLKEEYAPSDKEAIAKQHHRAHDKLAPHFRIFQFLASHYQATRYNGTTVEKACLRLLQASLKPLQAASSHPLARELHFHIVLLGAKIIRFTTVLDSAAKWRLKDQILSAGLAWFASPPRWSFGGNRLQIKAETHLLADVANALHHVQGIGSNDATSRVSLRSKQNLLEMLIASEQTRLMVWLFPLDHGTRQHFSAGQRQQAPREVGYPEAFDVSVTDEMKASLIGLLPTAWQESPALAISLTQRFTSLPLTDPIRRLILDDPRSVLGSATALEIMLGSSLQGDVSSQLKYLMYWAPVDPITAVTYFQPAFKYHPCTMQYAVRALESHSVDVTFFYVPQIVQALRYDQLEYVELYIIETAKFSQLFAHQIIWNIKANSYKDEDSQEPDPMKPILDKVTDRLIGSFDETDKAFYEREFSFFNEITGISGKLRPYLKKTKPEKKQKIEEELREIHVDVGVYLPSNPDGVVIGIDRKSGKPLQSHAKTPYMATFRIRKDVPSDLESTDNQLERINTAATPPTTTTTTKDPSPPTAPTHEIWQSAIFKVGDDCRQDVLALQLISTFRGIFAHVGLPLYVFPYRVTATAPGCGVIDVLPRSISRDMLGREAVNGLYPWFTSRFGSPDSPTFQTARANFVKSLAAYSIISYLLQFKDRHNGNIMFDDSGHILHIDFGFCFDIAPGGVKFERAPFKLTREMLAVMGGSTDTQSFRWFEELCVKGFLAARQHVNTLAHVIEGMLDSGLPCFKPETVKNFRERFVLGKAEREAAEFVRGLVRRSLGNRSTVVYDEFQLLTNGIPF